MKRISKWVLYPLYFIAATAFFLYYLFPTEKAKAYIESRLNGGDSEFHFEIDRLQPGVPARLDFTDITLSYRENPVLTVSRLELHPRWSAMFNPGQAFVFDGVSHGGEISGSVKISQSEPSEKIGFDGDLKQLRIEDIPLFQRLPYLQAAGDLNGKIKYKQSETTQSATALFTASESTVTLTNAVIELPTLNFTDAKAVLALNGNQVDVKNLTFTGPQLNCNIEGVVQLERPLEKSRVSLRGRVKPHEVFFAELKQRLPSMLMNNKRMAAGLVIKISGTLEAPNVSIQ